DALALHVLDVAVQVFRIVVVVVGPELAAVYPAVVRLEMRWCRPGRGEDLDIGAVGLGRPQAARVQAPLAGHRRHYGPDDRQTELPLAHTDEGLGFAVCPRAAGTVEDRGRAAKPVDRLVRRAGIDGDVGRRGQQRWGS